MRHFFYLMIILVHVLPSFGQEKLSEETKAFVVHERGTWVLQNLTIVDGTGSAAKTNQDIIIVNDIIK
jgi:hypothetical protein